MDINWIQCVLCGLLLALIDATCAQSEVEAHLVLRKYVEKGSSTTLHCETNVPLEKLYKVTWLKCNGTGKIFQYIKKRNPPFQYFDVPGAKIDLENSNQSVLTLKNLDFDAGGAYYCEVSIDSPIFTKESNEAPLHVVLQQQGPPKISLKKRQYIVGEQLLANCTTYKSRPAPHITWLINGKKVDEKFTKPLHLFAANGKNAHRSKNHPSSSGGSGSTHEKGGYVRVVEPTREEPTETNHFGFEVFSSSGYDSSSSNVHSGISGLGRQRHDNNNFKNAYPTPASGSTRYNYGNYGGAQPDYHEEKDKYFEPSRKHRTNYGHKFRRHAGSERDGRSGGGGGGSGGHRGASSSSQLSLDLSELYVPTNGRVEIMCLATIPAHVGPGEQYADYKTYSVKIDVNMTEVTTSLVEMSGMVAGNTSSRAATITGSAQLVIGRMSFLLPTVLPLVVLLFSSALSTAHRQWRATTTTTTT